MNEPAIQEPTLNDQIIKWKNQSASMPDLKCPKDEIYPTFINLLNILNQDREVDLDRVPAIPQNRKNTPWKIYSRIFNTLELAKKTKTKCHITPLGESLANDPSKENITIILASRIRLFGETLQTIKDHEATIEEINNKLVLEYIQEWKTLGNTRIRVTWLEALGMVSWADSHHIAITETGKSTLKKFSIISPKCFTRNESSQALTIPDPPAEIGQILRNIAEDPSKHDDRCTYNIWIPSPQNNPNKVDNLAVCIGAASEPIAKEDLLQFIAKSFNLKRSSVDSMLPFLRASGLLMETGRGVFMATPAAKEWLNSGSYIDFVRILHSHMRFVGELLNYARHSVKRNSVYAEGSSYGLNKDKIRWLISLLCDSDLLEESSVSSVRATPTGTALCETLPLAPAPTVDPAQPRSTPTESTLEPVKSNQNKNLLTALIQASANPHYNNDNSGAAFEKILETTFSTLGFKARRISGSGNTDVLIEWTDSNGSPKTAIIDGKSSSSGKVSHTAVSDIAIETHKAKHSADYVLIVAPGFSGDTIKNMARTKGWVLLEADELAELALSAKSLGIPPEDFALVFDPTDGISRLTDIIESRQRELDIISLVIRRLSDENESEDSLSARDISLLERTSPLAPSVSELMDVLDILQTLSLPAVRIVEESSDSRYTGFTVRDPKSSAAWLRAIATSLDQ